MCETASSALAFVALMLAGSLEAGQFQHITAWTQNRGMKAPGKQMPPKGGPATAQGADQIAAPCLTFLLRGKQPLPQN